MRRTVGGFGKCAPRFPVTLKELTAYAVSPLPAPSASVNFATAVSSWPMDGNDQYGDCTMAATAHCLQSWDAEAKVSDPVPTEEQVIATYLQLAGGQDTGLVESNVLQQWQQQGLWGNKIVGYATVNVHALTTLHQATYLFGGVYVGIQVPANAQQQFSAGQPWTLTAGWQDEQIVGSHAIPLLDYDARWLYCTASLVAQSIQIARDWWHTYGDEAWAVLSQEFDQAGVVNGIDVSALQVDLALI